MGMGAIAGFLPDEQKSEQGIRLGAANASEQYGQGLRDKSAKELEGLIGSGPGQQDVTNATGSSRDLATMLDQYSKGGYLPNEGDIATGEKYAGKLFQGQRTALGQNFQDQNNQFNQAAALMGRDPTDPVFRNKLMQEQTRQTALLDANQGAFGTQMALDSPFQRLQFKQQQNQVLGGLASQALANRQALAAMGEGIMNGERNFRLQTGTRFGTQTSGGGLKGAIEGTMAEAGSMMSMFGGFMGMGGGGGGQSPIPPKAQSSINFGGGGMSNSYAMPQITPNLYGSAGPGAAFGPFAPPTRGIGPFADGGQYAAALSGPYNFRR